LSTFGQDEGLRLKIFADAVLPKGYEPAKWGPALERSYHTLATTAKNNAFDLCKRAGVYY